MLHQVGMTPRQLSPDEFESVLAYGIGLTDLCKTLSGADNEVGTAAFDVEGLVDRVRPHAPLVIAFNGLNAGRVALGDVVAYGPQSRTFAGSEAWVLPSTSGAARRWWDVKWWRMLEKRVR